MAIWRVSIDTGGTFTDCLAVDPEGRLHRAKVLSTSALRGRLAPPLAGDEAHKIRLDPAPRVPADFFRGFSFHLLAGGGEARVLGYDADANTGAKTGLLTLDRPLAVLDAQGGRGAACELRSTEEAPILAARLVTGTPPGEPLPAMAMRLATTRGTNALLERKGARTALFITAGFADLLRIGTQQRPELFALRIEKPLPLYSAVIEVPERLAADGSVLRELGEAALGKLAEEARRLLDQGCEAAAVALLHSYRNPVHELALGDLLRRAGFAHVALSSGLAPLIKILPRAETAVVDAYLSKPIAGYLARVAGALPQGALHVMTSAGGLVRADAYRAKDSLLSGPAGGVVGAAEAGRRSGFLRVIAFDMGGTSTDVARYDGDFEYVFEHRVGDAHLVAPALAVESVAAGGGSICRYDGFQLKVGPESTGASPGPACYGAGGPLTLTDVNLLLGRLDPERFEIPLDVAAAERALLDLRRAMADSDPLGPAPEAEEVLSGLLDIADERMADATRRISLARGYDPSEYALVAFGGAGAQHACAVAARLGIRRVLVPEDASLLSAAGLSVAVVERFAERQVLLPLAEIRDRIEGWMAELGQAAVSMVLEEGVPVADVVLRRRLLDLRFAGQEGTIAIELAGDQAVEEAFAAAYRGLYGYTPEGRPIELVALRAIASSRPPVRESEIATAHSVSAFPAGYRQACLAGRLRSVPFYERGELPAGAGFAGPALVFERHSATVVPAGWQGRLDAAGALILWWDAP
ncbi:MAG TPA: hydantoinase/oxoprolinase family protein [Thermoanaerobaculia bacterium]|nr:hydantoinase/oxoprolinase family protein [Thermoanaerobaculia bacterium]